MDEDKSSIDEPIENTEQMKTETPKTAEKPKKSRSFPAKWVFWVVALMILSAGATYYYMNQKAKKDLNAKNAEIASQQQKITDQQKEIDNLKAAAKTSDKANDTPTTVPSAAVKENIKAAMDSKNYAALEQNMASSVYVIIAASEFAQNRTPAQAVNDLKYFESATSPWDFNLPAATLTAYQTGDYATYFPTTAYVGKAASGQVVSYQFDSSGKIKTIFMAADGAM